MKKQNKKMKKLIVLLSALVLVAGTLALGGMDVAYAANPTVTGTAVTDLGIGELRILPVVTATDTDGATIDSVTDLYIQIPTAVHAVFDTTVAGTVTKTGAFVVDATVTFTDSKTAKVNVTVNGGAGDTIIITGLKILGYGSASTALPLTFSIDGGTVYADANVNTDVTVIDDSTHNVLTGAALAVSNAVFGSASTYTIDFTLPAETTIPKDGVISLSFPGSDVTTLGTITFTGFDGTVVPTNVGSILTLTRQDDGTNAAPGAIQLIIPLVINGTATDAATIIIITGTTAGVTTQSLATVTTPAVTINPVAIANLSCVSSGSAGAIWLRWTVPLGTTGAYVVKDSLADILTNDADVTFNAATTFQQAPAWPTGTIGQANQQLVTALTPKNVYYFNVKAGGVGTSLSAVSNTVFCTAPTAYSGSAPGATTPTSAITSPTESQGIKAGESFTITGTSSDTGGSSIRLVEISLDDGATWYPTSAVTSTATGFDWNYIWSSPALGSYTIKTRATDWFGSIETPSAGVSVVVLAVLPSVTVEVGGPETETPAEGETPAVGETSDREPTPAELVAFQTILNSMQEQLVILLNQVVAMLQALLPD